MTTQLTQDWLDQHKACTEGREWLAKQGKERDGLKVLKKLRKCKLWDWYRWLAPRLMTHQEKVLWACFCAEQVLPIFEKKYPEDKRPRLAIEAARKWANDPSEDNRKAAAYAADADAYAAYAAAYAAAAYADAIASPAYAADAYAAAYAAYADAIASPAYAAALGAAYAAYAAANAAAYAAANAAAYAAFAYAIAKEKMRVGCAKEAERIIANSKEAR